MGKVQAAGSNVPARVIAYCATDELRRLVETHAGAHRVAIHGDPARFLAAAAEALVALVAAENLNQPPVPELIEACRAQRPGLPLLVITRLHRRLSRALARVRADDVVWIREAHRTLPPAIGACLASPARLRLAAMIEDWTEADAQLRRALAAAVRSPVPPRSVHTLAATAGVRRNDLERYWRSVVPPSATLTRFVQYLRALAVEELRSTGLDDPAIAPMLRVSEKTLQRASALFPDAGATLRSVLGGHAQCGPLLEKLLTNR